MNKLILLAIFVALTSCFGSEQLSQDKNFDYLTFPLTFGEETVRNEGVESFDLFAGLGDDMKTLQEIWQKLDQMEHRASTANESQYDMEYEQLYGEYLHVKHFGNITDMHIFAEMDRKFFDAEYHNAIDFHNFTMCHDALDDLQRKFFNISEEDYNKEFNELNWWYNTIAEQSRLNSSHYVWQWLETKFLEVFRPNTEDLFHLEELWLDLDNLERASRQLNDTEFAWRFKLYEENGDHIYRRTKIPAQAPVWGKIEAKFKEVANTRNRPVEEVKSSKFDEMRSSFNFKVGNNSDDMRVLHEIRDAVNQLEHDVMNFTEEAYTELWNTQVYRYEMIKKHSNISDPNVWKDMELCLDDARYPNAIDMHKFQEIYDHLEMFEHKYEEFNHHEYYFIINKMYDFYSELKNTTQIKDELVFSVLERKFFECYHIEDYHRIFTIWTGLDDLDKASPTLNDTDFWERFRMYEYRGEDVYNHSRLPENETIWKTFFAKFEEVRDHRRHHYGEEEFVEMRLLNQIKDLFAPKVEFSQGDQSKVHNGKHGQQGKHGKHGKDCKGKHGKHGRKQHRERHQRLMKIDQFAQEHHIGIYNDDNTTYNVSNVEQSWNMFFKTHDIELDQDKPEKGCGGWIWMLIAACCCCCGIKCCIARKRMCNKRNLCSQCNSRIQQGPIVNALPLPYQIGQVQQVGAPMIHQQGQVLIAQPVTMQPRQQTQMIIAPQYISQV